MATTVHAAVHGLSTSPRRDFWPPIKGWRLRPRRHCERCRPRCHMPFTMPAIDSAHTQRARKGCQVRLCGGQRRERSEAGGIEQVWRGYWLTCNGEAERPTAQRKFFNSETKCSMGRSDCDKVRWSSFTVRSGKHQLRGGLWRTAPPNCASEGPPSIPLEAAARGVTSAGSEGPHRAPLAPAPCGWTDGLFSFLRLATIGF